VSTFELTLTRKICALLRHSLIIFLDFLPYLPPGRYTHRCDKRLQRLQKIKTRLLFLSTFIILRNVTGNVEKVAYVHFTKCHTRRHCSVVWTLNLRLTASNV